MSILPAGWKWFHVTGNTYGTWLPGDPRGWRARDHKLHVEGDYRNPPPSGLYDALDAYSRSLLKSDAVLLTPAQRRVAGQGMVDRLLEMETRLLALSCGRAHYHILCGLPDATARALVGRAKKNAAFLLRDAGRPGRIFARGCRSHPVTDKDHQHNAFDYILNHRRQGAWVWNFRAGRPWNPRPAGARRR